MGVPCRRYWYRNQGVFRVIRNMALRVPLLVVKCVIMHESCLYGVSAFTVVCILECSDYVTLDAKQEASIWNLSPLGIGNVVYGYNTHVLGELGPMQYLQTL